MLDTTVKQFSVTVAEPTVWNSPLGHLWRKPCLWNSLPVTLRDRDISLS